MKRQSSKLVVFVAGLVVATLANTARSEELYPKHMNARAQKAIDRGLEYLAKTQNDNGLWTNAQDGTTYPCSMAALAGMAFLSNGNTPSRGPYADQVRKTVNYLISQARPDGLITSNVEFSGRSMYAHGFSLLFLGSVYGMENDERLRERIAKAVEKGVDLTGRAQSAAGGWTYTPGTGDEGSVTVTQMQGLRAAQNAGFTVPKGVVEGAVKYLEACKTPQGGIRYSFGSGGEARLAISAAAIATLYNAGEYDSPLANACMAYVEKEFAKNPGSFSKGGGHDYYTHLYASQAFYQAGDKHWDPYFPGARDQILAQQQADGSWQGDGIGPVYGTSIALVILQLPYKFVPIYQR
jgi:prenyltransferase beta subunit